MTLIWGIENTLNAVRKLEKQVEAYKSAFNEILNIENPNDDDGLETAQAIAVSCLGFKASGLLTGRAIVDHTWVEPVEVFGSVNDSLNSGMEFAAFRDTEEMGGVTLDDFDFSEEEQKVFDGDKL